MARTQGTVSHNGAPNGARAAVYCRVSTSGQEEDGTSLDTQEAACRRYAKDHGALIDEAQVYREVFSGAELHDRPRLTAMRAAVEQRAVDTVIAFATDRLARNPIHLAIVAEQCERAGVALHFVSEPLDSSPEGALIRYVKGYAAQMEREKIRERTLRGRRAIAESGKLHNSGVDLYGYRRDKETRTRSIDDAEAAVIRRIFHWVAEERLPARSITRRLNESGTPPPSAGKIDYGDPGRTPRWGKTMVYRILQNPAYKGEPVAWRYRTGEWKDAGGVEALRDKLKDYREHGTVPTSRWRLERSATEQVRLPEGTTPAIVSPELFHAAQERLAIGSKDDTRNQTHQYLLRGFIFCAVCGRRMYSTPERSRRTYRCSSRETPAGACGGQRVPAQDVEAWVWEQLAAILRDPSIIAAELQRQRDEGPDPTLGGDLGSAQRMLAKLTKQQERLVRRLREADDDQFPWEIVEREIRSIEQEKRQWQQTIEEIEASLQQQQTTVHRLDTLAAYCAAVAGKLSAFDFAEKRLAFEALGVRVDASGNVLTRDWRLSGSIPIENAGVLTHSCC